MAFLIRNKPKRVQLSLNVKFWSLISINWDRWSPDMNLAKPTIHFIPQLDTFTIKMSQKPSKPSQNLLNSIKPIKTYRSIFSIWIISLQLHSKSQNCILKNSWSYKNNSIPQQWVALWRYNIKWSSVELRWDQFTKNQKFYILKSEITKKNCK